MSTAPTQDEDRRRRRRRGLVLLGAGAALVVVAALALAVVAGGGRHRTAALGDGAGSAPVLTAPPIEPGPTGAPPDAAATPQASTPAGATPQATTAQSAPPVGGTDSGEGGGTATTSAPAPGSAGGSEGGLGGGTGSGSGSGSGSVPTPPHTDAQDLALTSTLSSPLRPGEQRTLHVTVRNPNAFAVQLYRLDVVVLAPPAVGCLPSWVQVVGYSYPGDPAELVPARSSVVVDLPITLVNLVDVDQDACQHTAFPLRLSGVGVSRG